MPARLLLALCAGALAVGLLVVGTGLAQGGSPVAGTVLTLCGGAGVVLALTRPARRPGTRPGSHGGAPGGRGRMGA